VKNSRITIALSLLALASCNNEGTPTGTTAPATPTGQPWFEDVSLASGVDFEHMNAKDEPRHWFPEIMGGGVAFLDYDGDGDLDLYLVQSGDLDPSVDAGVGNVLYQNQGGSKFVDVTAASGTGDTGYGMGCATGDYDGDGDTDIYVTNVGPNVLYRNNGDATFTDISADAGVDHAGWATSAGFFDADGDGDLDLFVCNNLNWKSSREVPCLSSYGNPEYCHPNNYNSPARDVYFENQGEQFVDKSKEAGFYEAFGNGLGVAFGDFNSDGRTDVYVANDGLPNQLWINLGGRFEDRALLSGCALNMMGVAEAGMGVTTVDIDEDGDLDLFMTHLRDESNTFYFNSKGVFSDRTARSGLLGSSLKYTGFGTGFADFDCDGKLDLYVANGRVSDWPPRFLEDDPYAEPDQVFRGLGEGRFEEVLPRGGTAEPHYGTTRGAALGDYDGDGAVDVCVVDNHGRAKLLRNITQDRGNWISLRLFEGAHETHGAMVRAVIAGSAQHRQYTSAFSYCAASDPRAHFGLAAATEVESATVTWPDGTRETFGPLAAGSVHDLRRGEGREDS
jgi:hypothetical protein